VSQTYPHFDGRCVLVYDAEASRILGADHWRRMESHRFMLSERQWLATPAGSLTDKGSIPRPAWSIVPRDGKFEQAFDMHDQACEYLSLTVDGKPYAITRERADGLLYVAMLVLGATASELAPVRAAVELHRRALSIDKPSNTAIKRALEAQWRE
jgi:hypothetical protein